MPNRPSPRAYRAHAIVLLAGGAGFANRGPYEVTARSIGEARDATDRFLRQDSEVSSIVWLFCRIPVRAPS